MDVIVATEAHFEDKGQSCYKHGSEKLEKCQNDRIEGDSLDE